MKKIRIFVLTLCALTLLSLILCSSTPIVASADLAASQGRYQFQWIGSKDYHTIPASLLPIKETLAAEYNALPAHIKGELKLNDPELSYYIYDNIKEPVNGAHDYISLERVVLGGDTYCEVNRCRGSSCNDDKGHFSYDFWFTAHLTIPETNANHGYSGSEEWSNRLRMKFSYFGPKKNRDSTSNYRSRAFYPAKAGTMLISTRLFDKMPEHSIDTNFTSRRRFDNYVPKYRKEWHNTSVTTYYLRAREPSLTSYGPLFSKDAGNPAHLNKIRQFDISPSPQGYDSIGLKLMVVELYKKSGADYIRLNDRTIIARITDDGPGHSSQFGVKNITVPAMDDLEEGEYALVVGCVDKFNKRYLFAPEYFLIDRTPPVISGLSTVDTTVIQKGAECPVMGWSTISDNYSTDLAEADFIYLKLYGENPRPISGDSRFIVEQVKKRVLLKEEGLLNIESFYLQDRAGNRRLIDELSAKILHWDQTAPLIELDPAFDSGKYCKSSEAIPLRIRDVSQVKIEELKLIKDGTLYEIPFSSEFSTIESFPISLKMLEGKEGPFTLDLTVRDIAGNSSSAHYDFKIDDPAPLVELYINERLESDGLLLLNHDNRLSVKVSDYYFKSYELSITSDVAGSANNLTLLEVKDLHKDILTLRKDSSVEKEIVKLEIFAFDQAGNRRQVTKTIELYNDNSPPTIRATRLEEGKYRVEAADVSMIKNIYVKFINLPASGTPVLADFSPIPPSEGWLTLDSEVRSYDKNLYVLPQYAACLFAEDYWGNISDAGSVEIFMENKLPATAFIISKKSDLDAIGWTLYGDVLVKTSLSIEPGETLNIITNSAAKTKVDFDASLGQFKLLNNGGTINLDSTNNEIVFRGAGASANDYGWFGIQHRAGVLAINSPQRIRFINAVYGLTYFRAAADIALSNLSFEDSFGGIHLIDEGTAFNRLNLVNCTFNNLVYGVKFDFDRYNYPELDLYKGSFGSAAAHISRGGSSFTNIAKGNLYCPVNGNLE